MTFDSAFSGHAVVDLKDRQPAGFQHPVALRDQLPGMRGVLDDAVCVDEVERVVGKRQPFAVGDAKVTG
jgi:hypothetical protein